MKTSVHPWRVHSGFVAWPTVGLALGVLLGYAALWTAVLSGGFPLLVGTGVATLLGYLAFTPLHDAAHGAIAGTDRRFRTVERLIGWVMAALLFAPWPAFRAMHLRHHGVTNDAERDPDFWVAGSGALLVALRCLTILPHYYVMFLGRLGGESPALRRDRRWSVVALVALLGTAAALTALGLGSEVLALWVVPAVLSTGVLAFLLDWVPHVPHTSRQRYLDTRVWWVPTAGWWTLGQCYHLVHHLYPKVPFYRYGALFRDIRAEVEQHGAEIREPLGSAGGARKLVDAGTRGSA